MASENSFEKHGYDHVAKLMGEVPELMILRRFAPESAEILLHRQAEILSISKRLKNIQKADKESPTGERQHYAFDSNVLRDSMGEEEEENRMQWETMLELEEKLNKYYKTVLLHRQIANLETPRQTQLESFVQWMDRPSQGSTYLIGDDRNIWKANDRSDFFTMQGTSTEKIINSSLIDKLVRLYHRILGRYIHTEEKAEHLRNTIMYGNGGISAVIRTTMTLAACLFPVAAIAILSAIDSLALRIGIIAILTAAFSTCLSLMTSATLKDIFSITAAFAAVLAVFVGIDSS